MKLGELLASKGRYGDTMLAHITPEEAELLKAHGGSGTINPETGLPEYWKGWKTIRKVAKIAAPIAGSLLLPGIGTALGIGGLTTATGAATALGGGLGGALGGAVGGAMGGGGIKGALTGGALGGAGGYLANGGLTELFPETSNALFNSTGGLIGSSSGDVNSGIGSLLGLSGQGSSVLGAPVGAPLSSVTGVAGLQGPTLGSGVAGAVGRVGNSILADAPSAIAGGGASSYGGLGTALGTGYSLYANDAAQQDLEDSQRKAMEMLGPYTQSGAAANNMLADKLATGELGGGFNPGDLTQDPGYQFNLEQGQQAIDRKNAASGGFFSGSSLKEAQDYGQGLADNTYNNAYQRYLQGQNNTYNMLSGQAGRGLGATGTGVDLTTTLGSAKANAGISTANIINQSLASLLAGRGRQYNYGYV